MTLEDTKYLRIIRRQMLSSFASHELQTFAFDLGVDWDELPGNEITNKTQNLIMYLARRGRLEDLMGSLGIQGVHPNMVME